MIEVGDVEQLGEVLKAATKAGQTLRLRGRGTLTNWGEVGPDCTALDTAALSGQIDYDAEEMVISANAATPLIEIERALAARKQMLACEPIDYGPLLGRPAGGSTLGGMVAANTAGPRRVLSGSVRDHCIGIEAVTADGRGFKAGGRVVKNVTGFDLPKLMTGSWGALAVLTRVTLRTVPKPASRASWILRGLEPKQAQSAMSAALQAPLEVSAAVHLHAAAAHRLGLVTDAGDDRPVTLFRLEGFAPSVEARGAALQVQLADWADLQPLSDDSACWQGLRRCEQLLVSAEAIWRVDLPAAQSAALLEGLRDLSDCWSLDWGGSRAWVALPPSSPAQALAELVLELGGQAQLVRAGGAPRAAITRTPTDPALNALQARVKAALDPQNVLYDRRHPVPEQS